MKWVVWKVTGKLVMSNAKMAVAAYAGEKAMVENHVGV